MNAELVPLDDTPAAPSRVNEHGEREWDVFCPGCLTRYMTIMGGMDASWVRKHYDVFPAKPTAALPSLDKQPEHAWYSVNKCLDCTHGKRD